MLRVAAACSSKIDVGLPADAGRPGQAAVQHATAGCQPAVAGYTLVPLYVWGINYFVVNFQSTTGNGPIIKQLYFRQALAYLMNQAAVISGPAARLRHARRSGPVGQHPGDPATCRRRADRATRSRTTRRKAKSLLTSHGWKVTPQRRDHLRQRRACAARASRQGQGAAVQLARTPPGLTWIAAGDDAAAVQRGPVGHQAQPGAQAVQPGHRPGRRQLRGRQDPVQLGHGQLGRRLVVRPGLRPDRRDAVHVRLHRELRRVLQHDQRQLHQHHAGPATTRRPCTPGRTTWRSSCR